MPAKKRATKLAAEKKAIPISAGCFNCKFSIEYEAILGEGSVSITEMFLCRRYPPTVLSDGSEYPVVGSDFWCGEHRYGDSESPHNA